MPSRDVKAFVSSWSAFSELFLQNVKLHFLWYDQLILEEGARIDAHNKLVFDTDAWSAFSAKLIEGEMLTKGDRNVLEKVLVPLSAIADGSITQASWDRAFEGYPRWMDGERPMYTYKDPQTPHEYAHNKMLADLEMRAGVQQFEGSDVAYAEGKARSAIEGVRTWAQLNDELETVLLSTEGESEAVKYMLRFAGRDVPQVAESDLIKSVAVLTLPDLSKLSWPEIIAIKREAAFPELRDQIIRIFAEEGGSAAAVDRFNLEARRLSRRIVLHAKPKPIKALFEMIGTNLPAGLFNPYSIFSGYKNFITQCHEAANRRWVYTLNELEDRVDKKTIKTPRDN